MVRPAARSNSAAVRLTVRTGIRPATIRAWARVARRRLPGPAGQLVIATVGRGRMIELNRRYRRRPRPTNVLSFHHSTLPHPSGPERVLGEIILCPVIIAAEAKRFGRTYRQHLRALLEHGYLHLLGLDHETPAERHRWQRYERRLHR